MPKQQKKNHALQQRDYEGNNAVILEVNSETDFVAKNEEFVSFVDYLASIVLKNDVDSVEEVLKLEDENETIEQKLIAITAKIGEKISFRRFVKVTKAENEQFGPYLHMGGRIATLVVTRDANDEVAKDVAMHVAAMNPVCARRDEMPEELLEHEKKVIKEQVMNEGKPEEIAEKMVAGRINKFYKESCLEEQEFIKDSSMTVGDFVKNNGGEIVSMTRFAVGEGIEKKEENFADEVMNQING